MPVKDLKGLTWYSLAYQPDGPVDELAGPDTNTRCESPRHRFGQPRPAASWVEVLGYPMGDKSVARCWKTCEQCHVDMCRTAEEKAHQAGSTAARTPALGSEPPQVKSN